MKCLQSRITSGYFFSLLLGCVLQVGVGYVRVLILPGKLLRAADPGSTEAVLQGDLGCPSIAPENSEVPLFASHSLLLLYFCQGFQNLCSWGHRCLVPPN